ncbi:T9SS type A sorting domain-containing protein [Aurantibacillus circumpalustris]|uniref:T9SS type A sorting domain-containing protein n=1 Tax=Aurantibacillus circumpalustris TaxID=3036359 RepID=UPI00295B0F2A|nr:T9SS type A sorting domain-containing protein [Aurantibacillus circumpalustris]
MKRKIYKLLLGAKQGLFALSLLVAGMAYSQTTYTFNYTGSTQTITLSGGSVFIQMWGADGGNNLTAGTGGKGGYSTGTVNVAPGTYYVYVGGKGTTLQAASTAATGGFNGGGNSGAYSSTGNACGSGGGASHVASATGLLSTLSGNQSAVSIVAGGGGGGGANHGGTNTQDLGANGGGLTGGNGLTGTYGGFGGTQVAGGSNSSVPLYSGTMAEGGSFGQGGSANLAPSGYAAYPSNTGGGGGGGWYGGAAALWEGGGGGSGYVGGTVNGTTAAVGQPGFVPNPDVSGNGMVIITKLCDVTIGASSNPVCQGSSVTLTTTAITTLSWSASVSTASSIVVTPTSNTTYYVTGIGTNNCVATDGINITMVPLPNVSSMVNPPLLCVGNTATLTGQGAITYTWSNSTTGLTTAVNPNVTTNYTVSGTNGFGCINNAVIGVIVNTNVISVSANTTICTGKSVNISASGAVTYTWSNNISLSGLSVSPTLTTVYSVIGRDVNNCLLSNSVSITVNDLPNVFLSTDKDIICKKESVVLSATGANTYAWSNPITGPLNGASLTLTLNIDLPYLFTVVGTGTNGCSRTATVSVDVQKCAGVNELSEQNTFVSVYPNPNNGLFTVESKQISSGTIEIMDLSGKIIFTETIKSNATEVNMSAFATGIYFVKVKNETSSEVIKLIKNQ